MNDLGRMLLIFGAIIMIVGVIMLFLPKIPFLGKLPGDILIKKDGFTFYSPIATSIIISIFLTLIITFFLRR